jgi:hypothetical protein
MFIIIVPYRDRPKHKKRLLESLPQYIEKHHGLKPNGVDYKIIVSEQIDNNLFNLSLARNSAALWAEKNLKDISHFIFHDVDVIPISNVDYLTEDSIYHFLNHGTFKITKKDFFKINGYNPLFIGWGEEDNEFREKSAFLNLVKKVSYYQHENYVGCFVHKPDGVVFLDIECEYNVANVSHQTERIFKTNNEDKWRNQEDFEKNKKLLNSFRSLDSNQKDKWIKTTGLNLVNLKFNDKINLDDLIIHFKYDNTFLDPKVFEIRNKL